jgi:pyruvate dehydrogenase E2 component (dihydrolipoamide acetyltransferase)
MIDILMPRLSDTMTEGAIAAWHKKPGDAVAAGDILLEIETDKALMEQEAYVAGTLTEILVPEGENVGIGTPIARLDDGVDHGTDAGADPASDATPAPAAPAPTASPSEVDRRAATPLVRRLAKERGVDLGEITGTGPGGRIVRADLDAAVASETAAAVSVSVPHESGATRVPFDGIRRQIAARLTESATTVPVFHATASADVTELLSLRAGINGTSAAADVRISVNDLIVKAVALALREHPAINASYSPDGGGQTLRHDRIDVGFAVAAPAGLLVPVVRDADASSITTIARRTRELAMRAADRTLTTMDMSGGTFTVSNLGMFGVEQFTAIINPPQGAILAVGAVSNELVLVDGEVSARKRLRYTLSADHRIIDGADAGRFLATVTDLLEEPMRLLL